MGDTINFSGQFSQSIINVKNTMTNVSQSVGTLPRMDAGNKEELQTLIDKLGALLEGVGAAKPEEAETVAAQTKALVDMTKQEKPNKTMLQVTMSGLKQAVDTIADIAPAAVTIASRIAEIVAAVF